MSFLSLEFILIFTMFLFVYWLLANLPKLQNGVILIGSYAFVSTYSLYATLILFSYSLTVYVLAVFSPKLKKRYLGLYIMCFLICMMFFLFKYYDAIREFTLLLTDALGLNLTMPLINIALPIGLSFYLFHSVSIIVEIYKNPKVKFSLLDILTYLSFFPSLVAGPINRVYDTKYQPGLMTQLKSSEKRAMIEPKKALFLLLMATFKLWVLSSYLDEWFVNDLFSTPANSSTLTVLLGLYAYAFQIYFNFSGYSELVLAIGMLLGFQLPINFRNPYLAHNLKIFWERWHISLSLFIRDYIYIPLGGSRHGFIMTQLNVLVAMTLSGVWHGAGLTFLVWGILHGIGQMFSNTYAKIKIGHKQKQLNRAAAKAHFEISKQVPSTDNLSFFVRATFFSRKHIARLFTFHFICFTWIFFRANNFDDAISIIQHLFMWDDTALLNFNTLSVITLLLMILFYPLIIRLFSLIIDKIIMLSWKLFILILIILMQIVIYIAPSGVPGFIYASF